MTMDLTASTDLGYLIVQMSAKRIVRRISKNDWFFYQLG